MNTFRIRLSQTLAALALCFATSNLNLSIGGDIDQHPYEGFTEPWMKIELAAPESGRVSAVNIKKGAIVKANQILVELDASVLEARHAIVAEEAQSTARIGGLKVTQAIQERRLVSVTTLQETGASTVDELLKARAEFEIATYHTQEAEEELRQKRLQLKEIEAQIAQKRIRSSINGIVTDIDYEVGEFVAASSPRVATVVDLRKLRASFFLPTTEAAATKVGQSVSVRMVEVRQTARGFVEYVGVETIADSGRVQVDVLIENPSLQYRSGLRCSMVRSSLPSDRAYDLMNTAEKPGSTQRN